MRKLILLLGILLTTIICAYGQEDINFKLEAPAAVEVGSQFRVVFSIPTPSKNSKNKVRIPTIKDFDILMGPVQDTQKEFKEVDGITQSYNVTLFTYVLQARKEGIFSIPAATATIADKKYVSDSATVKVVPKGTAVGENETDIFIQSISNVTTVYEQEPVQVTFKVYVRGLDIHRYKVELEAKDFISQDIDLSGYKYLQWVPESYEGKKYYTVILKKTLFYPQRPGQLEIGEREFDMLLNTVVGNYTPNKEIRDIVCSPPVKVNVKPLPTEKPTSFTNAVGDFTLQSDINTTTVKTNQPLTITLELSGTGNFALIENFNIPFPTAFETSPPEIEQSLEVVDNGESGRKTFRYQIIPRKKGTYTIPAIEFSYFDPVADTYKTLYTKPYKVKIKKGTAD